MAKAKLSIRVRKPNQSENLHNHEACTEDEHKIKGGELLLGVQPQRLRRRLARRWLACRHSARLHAGVYKLGVDKMCGRLAKLARAAGIGAAAAQWTQQQPAAPAAAQEEAALSSTGALMGAAQGSEAVAAATAAVQRSAPAPSARAP